MFAFSSATYVLINIFLILTLGYLIGRIEIKGVGLGSAAVFLVALVFGHLHTAYPNTMFGAEMPKILQNLGLVFFVVSVGFIAGPSFFHNLKVNAKSYVLLGLVIIVSGGLTCFAITKLTGMDAALSAGLLTGALTSTPGFSAAKDAAGAARESLVSVGQGIAYPFGVIGVVLFVQLMPRILKVNMDEERAKISNTAKAAAAAETKLRKPCFTMEEFGLLPIALGILGGILLGAIKIPLPGGNTFSLGNTGGPLIVALILGHFGRISRLDMQVPKTTSKLLRELGLVLFLAGAGFDGGKDFVEILKQEGPMLFVYGAIMTIVPMFIGYFVASKFLKLALLNNMGSITGGMTSTPALGTLITSCGTDDVAAAYAATYPIALVSVILVCQFLVLLG
ncbi:MAG: permease [Oscillospiraceae bacterium]|nr:permease [Oscillospiraceae bacterium]